jgi:hypothetical protein
MKSNRHSLPASPTQYLAGLALAVMILWSSYSLAATVRVPLADGFDHSVGKPNAVGYYKFRGFMPNGHLGEDWNGNGGGDTDLGDPICAIGDGVVVYSDNYRSGWGNVVIVRHAYRDSSGKIQMVDSLYGHLLERKVKLHEIVKRGQLVGTMGGNNGMYAVHLHLEVRKNLRIGMQRSQFSRGFENYHRPTDFIEANRTCPGGGLGKVEIPIDTFGQGPSAPPVQLATSSEQQKYRASASGMIIPVYRGSGTTNEKKSTAKLSPIEAINREAKARASMTPSVTATVPPSIKQDSTDEPAQSLTAAKPQNGEANKPSPNLESPNETAEAGSSSFWTRLKAKMKNGKIEAPSQSAKK